MFIISLWLVIAAMADAVLLPKPTGPYKVGTTVLEIVDKSRVDPFAPSPQARDLMISLFYPTDTCTDSTNCTCSPQFPPATALAMDGFIHVPNGTMGTFQQQTCLNAPLTEPNLPLLLFSPGLIAPRQFYSSTLAEVASYGWNVVLVDHPYDGLLVEYPDGRVVNTLPLPTANNTVAEILAWISERLDPRVADMISVLNALSDRATVSQIPGLTARSPSCLKTSKVGIAGGSFGGATALQTMANDTRFQAGINLDGELFGPVIQSGVDAPFMFFGTPLHNTKTELEPTWADAWPNLRGFKREYVVNGTNHTSYSDMAVWRDILGGDVLPSEINLLGTINGSRIMGIEAAFIDSFFGKFLKGQDGALLDGQGVEEWPEVTRIQ